MRKGFLLIVLALIIVFGVAMSAGAIDRIGRPSVGFVVPWVEGNVSQGLDTVIGIQNMPDDADFIGANTTRTVTWTFFRGSDSAHILDNDFLITPGQVFLYSWNNMKGANLDGVTGYLVFADPLLSTSTLTANAFQVIGLKVAAYVPVLQLRGGYFTVFDADGDTVISRNSLDGFSAAQQDLVDSTWVGYSFGTYVGGVPAVVDPFAPYSAPPIVTLANGLVMKYGVDPDEFYRVRDEQFTGTPSTIVSGSQIPEIVQVSSDRQVFVSPNTAWNGIQYGDIVVPRFVGGPNNPSLDSVIGIWKPDTSSIGGTVQFWNTLTEANVSLQFGSSFELVLLDPYATTILGNPNFGEGAVEIRNAPTGWPTPGGIVFTLVSGIVSGTTEEIQTLIAPHYPAIP